MMTNLIQNILTYSYYVVDLDALIFCLDNFRFVNHSSNANVSAPEDENEFCAVVLRVIQIGEEILENYSEYLICFWLEKYRENYIPCCW